MVKGERTSTEDGREIATMTWKPIANLVFQTVLIVVLAAALHVSLEWPRETALFPQAVGTPVLLLLLISLGLQVLRIRRFGLQPDEPEMEETEVADRRFLGRAAIEFAWLLGFGLAIWVIGFFPAAFAFLLLYLVIQARLSALSSFLWSIAAVGFVFVVFNLVLQMDAYGGLLAEVFR